MRVCVAASTVLVSILITSAPLVAATSDPASVVISEFRTRGPNGVNDEFIELYNKSGGPVDISGWKLRRSSEGESAVISDIIQIPAGTSMRAGSFYLLANSKYSGTVTPDLRYTLGVDDAGGIAVVDGSDNIIDQVGMGPGSLFGEGTKLAARTAAINQSYERNNGGCVPNQDTGNNAADFRYNGSSSYPQDAATDCQGGCSGVVCLSPPAAQCWQATGTCTEGTCHYAVTDAGTGCSDDSACTQGDTCDGAGSCVPGAAVTCASPPGKYCSDSTTLVTYASVGTCDPSTGCSYTQSTEPCEFGCSGTTGACNPNPCQGVNCPIPNDCTATATCVQGSCVYTYNTVGTTCNDGNACTEGDACDSQGKCVSGTQKAIDDQKFCTLDACDPTTGAVTHTPLENGSSCEDGNLCNGAETCQEGLCAAGTAKQCLTPPNGGCYETVGATCDSNTGTCTYLPSSATKQCNDGNLCTTDDQCDGNGHCVGSAKPCDASHVCTDLNTSQYKWNGTCNENTGSCAYTQTNKSCATGCNSDSGLCNADPCENVVCNTPPDTCHVSTGSCSGNGICSYALKDVNASCNDDNLCTNADQCSSGGNCQGTPLDCNTAPTPTCVTTTTSRVYSASGSCTAGFCNYAYSDTACQHGCNSTTGLCANDPCAGKSCDTPPSQCHQDVGTCTNGTCSYALKAAQSPCDDANICTENDICSAEGTCAGTPKVCNNPPASTCNGDTSQVSGALGTCDSLGQCKYTKVDTACTAGCNASTGLCNNDPCASVTCNTPPGPCSADQGTCTNGACTYAPKPATVTCNDGNDCTSNDTCDGNGNCTGTPNTNCGSGGTSGIGGDTSTGGTTTLPTSSTGGVAELGGTSGTSTALASTGGLTIGGASATGTGGSTTTAQTSSTGGTAGTAGATQSAGTTALASTGTTIDESGADSVQNGGCNCTVQRQPKGVAWGLALIAVVLLRRRRKA